MHQKSNSLHIDLLSHDFIHRVNNASYRTELIAKAIGIKKYKNILDLTAGLGTDSCILASLNCKVIMIEKNKIIHNLLKMALNLAKNSDNKKIMKILNNTELINACSVKYLNHLVKSKYVVNYPEVIYFDPMFPKRSKSALVKKEMRILAEIVKDDLKDIDLINSELLDLSLKIAKYRVVVKRAKNSPFINKITPDFQYCAASNRFDIYLCSTNTPNINPLNTH